MTRARRRSGPRRGPEGHRAEQQRAQWARDQREHRRRERLGLIKLTAEVSHSDLCDAIEGFALHSQNGGSKRVAELLRMVRADQPGWQGNKPALDAMALAILIEWIKQWKRENVRC